MAILDMIPPEYWRQLRKELNAIDWAKLDREEEQRHEQAAREKYREEAARRRREKMQEYGRRYREANREKVNARQRERNARKKAARDASTGDKPK